jgi:integrase
MNFVEPIRDLKKLDAFVQALRAQSERNYMLGLTGINTGLRISDLLKLRVRDVQCQHIVLKEKKTKKRNKLKLNDSLNRELKAYIANKDGRVFLFRSRQGANKPISRSAVYKAFRQAAAVAGLRDIGTHTLRKTFGYHMYLKNKDVVELQRLFNHSNPSITLRYIGVTQDALDTAMDGFSLGFGS